MAEINRFAVIGGDLRQAYLAQSIAQDGYFVYAAALDEYSFSAIVRKTDLRRAVEQSTHIILPLPVTRDGLTVFAPYAAESLPMDDFLAEQLQGKPVFCGQAQKLPHGGLWDALEIHDYFDREDLAVRNAIPTAEGAIQIAMQEFPATIHGSRCLVAGYGRIGRVLARILHAMGAKVSVSARRPEQLAWIESEGMRPVRTELIRESGQYDIIFNTIPSLVFDARTLAAAAPSALFIELASLPYGIDLEAAERLNIPVMLAQSLPGKVAPQTAGIIIKQAIYSMLHGE